MHRYPIQSHGFNSLNVHIRFLLISAEPVHLLPNRLNLGFWIWFSYFTFPKDLFFGFSVVPLDQASAEMQTLFFLTQLL